MEHLAHPRPRRPRRQVPLHRPVARYHPWQIALHWFGAVLLLAIVVPLMVPEDLVVFGGFALPGSIEGHAELGILLFVSVILRLVLRLRLGVPQPEQHEPRWLRGAGGLVHAAMYSILLLMTMSGATMWLFGHAWAHTVHHATSVLLGTVVCLHAAAALFHHHVLRTPVLRRMMFDDCDGDDQIRP
jgi:cytochrome b561